jgi:hypothetical protein
MKTRAFQLSANDISAIRTAEERFGDGHVRAAVRDLFTLGLYLRITGKTAEGYKACSTALRALQVSEALFKRVLAHLDGNEEYLASVFKPHVEFSSLVEQMNVSGESVGAA